MSTPEETKKIRALNDTLRILGRGGQAFITCGIEALGPDAVLAIRRAIADFSSFSEDNDPYGEHDFGSLSHEGRKIFWKIDYYDATLEFGSPDPSDPRVTKRVMTIMLAEEY